MIRPSRQIWLCLHLPALALEVFIGGDRTADDNPHRCDDAQPYVRPMAVIEQQRVVDCNAAAAARGIEAAMTLNTAHALCPDLQVLERQRAREQETLQQLAHWIYRFSPELALADANSLSIEIGCCRRLYGGLAPLLDLLHRGLAARGHRVIAGLAHTRKAAWLLAQHRQPPALNGEHADDRKHDGQFFDSIDMELLRRQIGALPIALMAIDRSVAGALQKMGIANVAQLTALPLSALGKRFGVEFIRYLQQILGTHPDPQPTFIPAPTFYAGLSFVDGIHNRQALLFPMKRLLQSLCDYLDARQLLCTTLHWELHDAHAPQATLSVELMRAKSARGRRYLRDLLELSELKLQNLPLRDAVYTLILRSADFLPAQPNSLQLFDDESAGAAPDTLFDGLIDKLRARLGAAALHRVHYRAAHWPEAASAQQTIDAAIVAPSAIETQTPRPLWLLPQPQALRERDRQLFWPASPQSAAPTALQLLRGPERIDNHWWEQEAGARDYYVAHAGDGRLCWIFRDLRSGQWFVHGLFA